MQRRNLYLAGIACSIAFILLVIFPWRGFDPLGHWHRVGWIPFGSRPVAALDVIGNLVLFVPMGTFIALHAQRSALVRTFVAAFACSLFGEWSQVYSRFRYPTTQDLLLNVTGAVIAAFGVDYLRRRRLERAETERASRVSKTRGGGVTIPYKPPGSSSVVQR